MIMEREIDNVKTSMNVQDLNRLIISLRHTSKICKTQIIQKITRKIAIYKNKKGSESQINKNLNKCQNLLEEIQILKNIHVDSITKYALNSPLNLEIISKNNCSIMNRALTRVACHKLLKKCIQDWRIKHEDWKSLASFLQTHISRRYKKKKPNLLNKMKNIPLIIDKIVAENNVIQKFCLKTDSSIKLAHSEDKLEENLHVDSDISIEENDGNIYNDADKIYSFNHCMVNDENDSSIDTSSKKNKKKPNANIMSKLKINTRQNSKSNPSMNEIHAEAYKSLLLDEGKDLWNKGKIKTNIKEIVDYKCGNILVKEFDLDHLQGDEELKFGLIEYSIIDDASSPTVTKDNFFLRDGENENDVIDDDNKIMLNDEAQIDDYDETEYKGKYPNKFAKNGRRFDRNTSRNFENKQDFRAKKYAQNNNKNFQNDKFVNKLTGNSKFIRSYKKNVDKSKLHPSWAASKMKKEQQTITKFQGKKIVFDD